MLLDFYTQYTYKGIWDSATQYKIDDIVLLSNQIYVAIQDSINKSPLHDMEAWNPSPFNYRGSWDQFITYSVNDAVLGSNNRLYYVFTTPPSSEGNPDPTTMPTPIPWQLVFNTRNSLINNIRDLVQIGLSNETLPDNIILKSVYFRSSELDIIDRIGLTQEAYNAKLLSDADFRERVTIAIEKRSAAKIIPALPQIIEERVLNVEIRYAEIDWQERINLLIAESDDEIKQDLPGAAGAIFGTAYRYVGF